MAMITAGKKFPLLIALAIFLLPVVSCSCPSTPSITSISPNSASAGGAAFAMTVNGKNFNSNSVVVWNGTSLTMSLVSSKQLQVTVPASEIAQPETAFVYVYNPGSGTQTTTVGSVSATDNSQCSVAASNPAPFTVKP